jgi:PAB-dependent poly(A)-specific ribonuclease subunit 2
MLFLFSKGRVTSHFGSGLHRYTSFRAHLTPVRQILVSDRGVISLSSDSIKMTSRRGLIRWTLRYAIIIISIYRII